MNETSRKVSAFDARTHLGELLDYVRYSKNPCLIERHGKPVAALIDIDVFQKGALQKQYQEWIGRAVQQIQAHYDPEKIILFGSAAKGNLHEGSDIDFFIIKKTQKRKLDRIDEVLEFLDIGNPIELHIYTPEEVEQRLNMGDLFIEDILKSGKILYERK